MNAQDFLDTYKRKNLSQAYQGTDVAAQVGIPGTAGGGRELVQMDVPGFGPDERINAAGVFGSEKVTDPRQLKFMEEAGMAPYQGQMAPPRSSMGKQFPIPAVPTFNREATERYMPGVMEGIPPGMMPGYR